MLCSGFLSEATDSRCYVQWFVMLCLVLSCHISLQRSVKILVSNLSVKHSKVSFSFLLLVILTCFELQELQIDIAV